MDMWTTSVLPTYPQPNKFVIMKNEVRLQKFADQEPAWSALRVEHRSVEMEKSIPLLTPRQRKVCPHHLLKRRRRDAAQDYLESGAAP
jgi:hypothetical protein